jgi:hypothetical protein
MLVKGNNSNSTSAVAGAFRSIGWANTTQQASISATSQDNVADSNTHGILRSDRLISHITAAGNLMSASLDSFDSDGFTLDRHETTAASATLSYLALAGTFQSNIGVDTQKTSTGTKATTGIGFAPDLVFFGSAQRVADSAVTAEAFQSVGAADGTAQNVAGRTDHDALGSSQGGKTYSTAKVLRHITVGAGAGPTITTVAEADVDSLDGNGFTLDWTTADATAREFFYLAIGADVTVTPSTLALSITTFAPTVTASDHKTATPTTLALVLTTFAPTVTATVGDVYTVPTVALTLTTFAPTVLLPKLATPTTASLEMTLNAPVFGLGYVPTTASLVTATFAPTLIFGFVATPVTANLILFEYQPEAQGDFDPIPPINRLRPERSNESERRERPAEESEYRFRPAGDPRRL